MTIGRLETTFTKAILASLPDKSAAKRRTGDLKWQLATRSGFAAAVRDQAIAKRQPRSPFDGRRWDSISCRGSSTCSCGFGPLNTAFASDTAKVNRENAKDRGNAPHRLDEAQPVILLLVYGGVNSHFSGSPWPRQRLTVAAHHSALEARNTKKMANDIDRIESEYRRCADDVKKHSLREKMPQQFRFWRKESAFLPIIAIFAGRSQI